MFEEGKSRQELCGSPAARQSPRKPWRTGGKTTFFFFFFDNNRAKAFFRPFFTQCSIKIHLAGALGALGAAEGGKAAALPASCQGFLSPSLTSKIRIRGLSS